MPSLVVIPPGCACGGVLDAQSQGSSSSAVCLRQDEGLPKPFLSSTRSCDATIHQTPARVRRFFSLHRHGGHTPRRVPLPSFDGHSVMGDGYEFQTLSAWLIQPITPMRSIRIVLLCWRLTVLILCGYTGSPPLECAILLSQCGLGLFLFCCLAQAGIQYCKIGRNVRTHAMSTLYFIYLNFYFVTCFPFLYFALSSFFAFVIVVTSDWISV